MDRQKIIRRISTLFLAAIMLTTTLFSQTSAINRESGTAQEESLISKVEEDLDFDLTPYLDSSKVLSLPEGVTESDEVSIIVALSTESVLESYDRRQSKMDIGAYAASGAGEAARERISAAKSDILDKLERAQLSYRMGYEYNLLLSGFEVVIKAEDYGRLYDAVGNSAELIVSEVYEEAEAAPGTGSQVVQNDVNVYDTGIFNSSGSGYDGSGTVVAVLDTGYDYTHSAYSVANFTSTDLAMPQSAVSSVLRDTNAYGTTEGLTVQDVYLNDKIPFAYDYADQDADVYPIESEHGTHVAAIIGGKNDVITGVAPNCQLVLMKVFSDTKTGAYTSWLLSALEDCVTLGVDVINMSLGSSCGFTQEEDDKKYIQDIYDSIAERGISLVTAASNDYNSTYGSVKNGNLGLTSNPDTATVGSPSTYEAALSVASIAGVKTPYMTYNGQILYFTESTDASARPKNFVEEILAADENEKAFEYVTIPGVGRSADYTGLDVTGKIALVRRGDNTFEEKAIIAQSKGAAGVIIYNNVSGDISMTVGLAEVPVCSISQDDGEILAAQSTGTLYLSRDQVAGPFISNFSSWGPTPDLRIKPEITAHGGEIYSAVPGEDYDRLSGTSMASPNQAGVTALIRQYVKEHFAAQTGGDAKAVAAMVNQIMMSTTDIALNTNGLPYSVRRQGAGLANLTKATTTKAYLTTYDREGNLMDKSKLEVGDDPSKSGVYQMTLAVNNVGNASLTYDVSAVVMTEGVSDTLTDHQETTVTEQGYLLEGATIKVEGSGVSGTSVTVGAGQSVTIKVTITLSEADKEYLNESFENGMYVEGFLKLTPTAGTEVALNVPYLAFYGDWTQAPLFDLDYFETDADEMDDSILPEDKVMADAYATRPVGGLYLDYISYLGSYYFVQDPSTTPVSAKREHISLSNQEDSVNSIYGIWAGMLRGAKRMELTITDNVTGEVVYRQTDFNQRKSYNYGGAITFSSLDVDFKVADYNLKNNTEYTVKLTGYLDYGEDGGLNTNKRNTFEFPFVTDFEAPSLTNVEYYTEYDKSAQRTRLYARLYIYDNHYTMGTQLGRVYLKEAEKTIFLEGFNRYVTPVNSSRNSTSVITYELTDYMDQIRNSYNRETQTNENGNSFIVICYDYAMNQSTYEVRLPDNIEQLYFGEPDLTISPNEVVNLEPMLWPNESWAATLEYSSTDEDVARVVNGRLVGVSQGDAVITVSTTGSTRAQTRLNVRVLGPDEEGYQVYSKPVADSFKLTGYLTDKAFYFVNNSDREIGLEGAETSFGNAYSLSMYPSEQVTLEYNLKAYFPENTEVVFESGNDRVVTVDANGKVTAVAEGSSVITVRVLMDGKSTYYSQNVSVTVKDPYVTNGMYLMSYNGNGGVVDVGADLPKMAMTEVYQYAFSGYEYVEKGPEDEISEEDPSTMKISYLGNDEITKIILPEGFETIGAYAFAGLTALEEVVLPSTLTKIQQGAFEGCISLKHVEGLEHVKFVNQNAFKDCVLETADFSSMVAIGNYAFENNVLVEITLPQTAQSIGMGAFRNNTSLSTLTISADQVKLGNQAFANCSSLVSVKVNAAVIPSGVFDGCSMLAMVELGRDVSVVGAYAFRGTQVKRFTVDSANPYLTTAANGSYLLNEDGTTLILAAPYRDFSTVQAADLPHVTTISTGAFAGIDNLTTVVLPNVTTVGDYAFAGSRVTSITLGTLTEVGDYAFYQTPIQDLPDLSTVSYIGRYAFAGTLIDEVNLGDGVTVGDYAFADCSLLSRVTAGDNVTLGDSAFRNNGALSQVIMGNNAGIGAHAFAAARNILNSSSSIVQDTVIYYYVSDSKLLTVHLGENAEIGEGAFYSANALTDLTLGAGTRIGAYAFAHASALASVDLSGVTEIGYSAFYEPVTGYISQDGSTLTPYLTLFDIMRLTEIDLSSLEQLGDYAFANHSLTKVTLGDKLDTIGAHAFSGNTALAEINLNGVLTIGDYAFQNTALATLDLSSVDVIGEGAFAYTISESLSTYNPVLTAVTLKEGASIGNMAFAHNAKLTEVNNLEKAVGIGDLAFAYTGLTQAELGENLVKLGENPFLGCALKPFTVTENQEFNGQVVGTVTVDTYDINDTVKVIGGALYRVAANGGYELITYPGAKTETSYTVADQTVRIGAYAFANTGVVNVVLPVNLKAIGHMAFYGCENLNLVVFQSIKAPILEEEYDEDYLLMTNLPFTGKFQVNAMTSYDGLGIVPYYMWNVTSQFSNFYFGANFVDYIGHVDPDLIMIRPSNGTEYDSFIYGQYFGTFLDGTAAPSEETLGVISAIAALPDPINITLANETAVVAARTAYNALNQLQQTLVTNYDRLTSAENTIAYLKGQQETPGGGGGVIRPEPQPVNNNIPVIIVLSVVAALFLAGTVTFGVLYFRKRS